MILIFVLCTSRERQNKTTQSKDNTKSETNGIITSTVPNSITRTIQQDRNGNIWIAAFDGIFRYDGRAFTNIIKEVSSARFFSLLGDRKGNWWFGTVGSGVYYYDGKSFQNLTTKDGLLNDNVTSIYEDKKGNIWTSSERGHSQDWALSRYDGNSLSNKHPTEIINKPMLFGVLEASDGSIWFGALDGVYRYDGNTITSFIGKKDQK